MTENKARRWQNRPIIDTPVVIIEDHLLLALDLEDAVSTSGLNAGVVSFASRRKHALQIGGLAAIAFVDVNLADGPSGPEIGRILAQEHDVTVIFTTADPDMLGTGVPGTLGVLTKPISAAAVHGALAYAIARRRGELAVVPAGLTLFAKANGM
jgi:DNA-binding NarL/FixJ family response regulator